MKYIVLFQHLQLKNIGLVLLCSFMFSNLLYSQSTREVINFDHGWLFNRYGLQPDGKRIDEPFGNGSPDSPSPKELAFNDKDWRKLDVPHDWGIEGPFRENLDGYTGKLPWRGIGWYRKRFNIKNIDKDKMFFLDFDGVMANAEVYLNGKKIGERPYGYISFRVNLTPYIRFDSENIIAVRVDTEKLGSRWYPGAGIYRHVRLVKTNKLHIPQWGVFISTPEINSQYATASVMVQLANGKKKTARSSYTIEIFKLDKANIPRERVAVGAKENIKIAANAIDSSLVSLKVEKPQLWDLENTNLYLAKVSVYDRKTLTDVYDVPFGFRTLKFTHNNGFLLNGKRVQLKGVCMHHDLGALGTAINKSAIERQINILKSFGANAIRTSHNPPAPELLELADKMGILILDEVFDCWASGKNENDYAVHYSEWHKKDIEALVCRDRNHPSVIMWSLGNEVEEQYHPEKGVAAINKSAIERQINILKSFGANAIRTSHNPPAPELLELADKMGILILDEVFDCWASGKNENDYAVHYSEWHKKDIEALVCRDRNHPSVIMWSLGNEVEEQYHPEKGVAAYLRDIVRLYDSTRPVTFGASYPSKSAINGTELQVDVHGMNYPSGGYGGPDFYETFLNYPGHEHLSGFASESSSTISSRGVYFPKGYQVTSYDLKAPGWASLADAEFAALDKYPAICGEFVWTGFDYLGEPTPFNSDMSVLLNHAALSEEELAKAKEELKRIEKERPSSRSSYFGIVDLAGFPKDRYYLYKAHWMPDEPMAHILPHWNFPDRIGKITPVFVYSSGDEVELFLNGESLGRKKKEQYQYRFKWENVIYTPGELKAIAYKNGKLWATESVRTTGEPALLQVSAYKDKIKVADNELAFITVSIRDKTGSVVPTANHKIKCKLEGEGKIVATDNGDPTSLISFSATERETFNGFMLVVIKAHQGAKGKLRLIVESENLKSASVDINLL